MTDFARPIEAASPPFARTLLPLLALALAMAVGFTMMGSFGTVQEGAKAELHLSDYTLSLIQGLSAALPLAVFSIPIGILVDRYNRVRMMIGLALVWTLGTVLTGFAQGVPVLFVARMLTGIGTTGALTAALSLCADFCVPTQRGRAMLVVNLGKSLGIALALGLSGALFGLFSHGGAPAWFAGMMPWRSVHLGLAVISVIAILPLFLLREPARQEVAAGTHAPFKIVAGELWARRVFLIPLFIGQISVVMADAAAGIWVSPVLSRNFHLQPDQFAGWMGTLLFGSGVVGAIIGGLSADRGQKSGRRGGLLIGAIVAAAVGVPAALFPIMPSVPLFGVAVGLLVTCGAVTGVVTSVALTVLIPNELRGLCIGAFIAIAGLIGYGLAPTLVAAASGMLGGEAHLAQGLAIVGVVTSAISVIAFTMAMRRAPVSATD
ncbi:MULTISPECIES: MFS transporter [unclassified Sphingomonas]|uniref:MFS transporter n=1 Tax=unclassified Sphingomonas TaxID=196159 RepID=UPI000E73AEF1|nr:MULTISPECIES: MFS transporter [unclassified Sphingomonas]RKE50587.1 putative MFS family arabinose efflux permease [Sphingomonas sp. PP-CC-1A-547]TCM08882.1 putative MFS family arabinose efflux permease [Sphingomonas sp. PP-CC-3G-468]